MLKQTIHNKAQIEEARAQHKAKMRQALEMVETIQDPLTRSKEYKKLSKISFRYYAKPKAQQDLERMLATIKTAENANTAD